MKIILFRLFVLLVALTLSAPRSDAQQPAKREREILIGVEYAMPGMGKAFSEMGVPAMKPLAEPFTWGKMQPRKDAPIDFKRLDDLVREYHDAGFTEIVVGLRALSPWATPRPLQSQAPAPEFMPLYEEWILAIVERYDGDGKDDMPGLKRPVRIYEIGTEFSSYQPEPVADYLRMLERAYKVAHAAFDKVVICHAAFLTSNAFNDNPKPHEYEQAFAKVSKRIMHHSLADMRAVLDRPDIFDLVNVHALEDPTMIEPIVGWLRWEMRQRKYNKAIIISDTTPSPFIAWGPATRATGNPNSLGIVVSPATEADRPRLAEYFTKLVDGDKATTEWTHAFVGADMVKKIVIAAEQQVALINTSFMEDLAWFKLKPMAAGAGVSAWAGMAEVKINVREDSRTVTGLRSSFYAVKQIQQHIKGYDSVLRIHFDKGRLPPPTPTTERIRWYVFTRGAERVHVAWLETDKLLLPDDKVPPAIFNFPTKAQSVIVEKMIAQNGQTKPDRETERTAEGRVVVTLTPTPIFILEK